MVSFSVTPKKSKLKSGRWDPGNEIWLPSPPKIDGHVSGLCRSGRSHVQTGNIWRPNTMKHCCTVWSNGINPFWPPSIRTKRFTIFDERFVDLPELSNISKHHQTRQCPNGKMVGNQMFDRVLSPKISLLDSRSAAFPRRDYPLLCLSAFFAQRPTNWTPERGCKGRSCYELGNFVL